MVLNWSPSVFRVSESPSDPIDAAFRHSVIFLKIDFWGSKTTFSRTSVILQAEKSVFHVEKNHFFGFDNDRRVICFFSQAQTLFLQRSVGQIFD